MDELMKTPDGKRQLQDLHMQNPPQASPIEQALILAGKEINVHNFENLAETKGCTAIVTLVANGTLYVANAGDSRCVMAIGGRAIPLSTDHKPSVPSER